VTRRRLLAIVVAGGVLLAAALVGVVLATSGSSSDELVVYSARSHYGEEEPFREFARERGVDITLFGGSATELYERIRAEGERTRADVLITVDGANLWRAKQAGLLAPVRSQRLERSVPSDLRDPDRTWFALTQRARTIVRSTERVGPNDVTTYEQLGHPRWRGRLCLRSGTSEYNVSFVADRLGKDPGGATERMLRRWMANEPEILGSDTDVLEAIADGRCDVGLANSYYLGRELDEDPRFPVALVWADQSGRGTHVNLSGIGVLRASDRREEAVALLEHLLRPGSQAALARNNHEFPVAPGVEPTDEIARFGGFKRDPINVDKAGALLDDALQLMEEVGWD
jgi:iron(III) transport system substrate-binding protein